MDKKMNIACCFAVKAPTGLSWPGIHQDYEERMNYYKQLMDTNFSYTNFNFEFLILNASTTDNELDEIAKSYDGVIMFLLAHGTALGQRISQKLKHGLIVDDPFGGSGDIIRTTCVVKDEDLPIETIGTLNENALIHKIKVYLAIPQIQSSRILVFKNFAKMSQEKEEELKASIGTGSTMKRYIAGKPGFEKTVNKIKDVFGVDVVVKDLNDLENYKKQIDENKAQEYAKKWKKNAVAVIEPTDKDLFESAKMHLALENAKKDCNADVVSVDCILMFFAYDLGVYPCLSFFEMNNNGEIGVCEGDLEASVTCLISQIVADRPGFVSDPFVDTENNQVVFAHCVASCKPYGPKGPAVPYKIRTHAEDDLSAALQVEMPTNEPLTTFKVSSKDKAMIIHSGVSIGNIDHKCGCRTKLVESVSSGKQIMKNWHNEMFSWHRVTVIGDYRKDFTDIAKYLGLKLYEEDVN